VGAEVIQEELIERGVAVDEEDRKFKAHATLLNTKYRYGLLTSTRRNAIV